MHSDILVSLKSISVVTIMMSLIRSSLNKVMDFASNCSKLTKNIMINWDCFLSLNIFESHPKIMNYIAICLTFKIQVMKPFDL